LALSATSEINFPASSFFLISLSPTYSFTYLALSTALSAVSEINFPASSFF